MSAALALAVLPASDGVSTFRLDNGLTVVVSPRRASPVVAVQAWVGAGSADETPAQAGIAHVIEHMLFKGTARRPVGAMTAEIEAAGGDINAWTSFDQTVYHVTLGRGDLEVGLDVLADAIIDPIFDEDELERERAVIVQEIRQGLDDPSRTAAHALFATAYVAHPYRRPVIGTLDTVRALRRDDLVAWHRAAYVADNVTVVIAGDVSADDARRQVTRHFGRLRSGPVRRLRVAEPGQVTPRGVVARHEATDAHVVIGFHAPPLTAGDTPVLDLTGVVLGQGDASRLAPLRDRRELLTGVVAHLQTLRDPGLFVVSATARPERVGDAVAAIMAEITRAALDVTDAEVDKARTAVLADEVWQRETAEGLARKLGWHQAIAGTVTWERDYLERIRTTTAADMRAAIARVLRADNATVAAVVPPRSRLRAGQLVQHLARGAKQQTRSKKQPKKAGGDVRRVVLDNGLRLLVMRDTSVPVVAMRAVWPGGTRLENDKTSGTTSLLASTITRGCGDRDGDAFAAEVDRLAGGVAAVGGRNSFGLRAEWLSKSWAEGLELFADCVLEPRFDATEVDRQRRLLLDDLAARADSGSQQAFRLFAETLYGTHPYHLDVLGNVDSVADLTPKKLARFYKAHFPPSAMTLAIVGDVDPDDVIARVEARFADVPARDAVEPKVTAATFSGKKAAEREVYRYLPREQAHLIVGFPGTTVNSADRFAVEVLASILGGQSGRLFTELRDKQALAYRVSAFAVDGLDPGYLAVYVSCSPENVDAAVAAIRAQIDAIVADGVTDAEVERTVRYLTGAHAVAMQRRSAIANALAFHEAYGLGWKSWATYPDDLAAVDAAAVSRAAKRYLQWDLAVTATVRPPALTEGAAKRARGKVHKKTKVKPVKKKRRRPAKRSNRTS
jgi:zinc protease